MAERDMRKWEDLSVAERRQRLQAYDKKVKAENATRRASETPSAKPTKKKGDALVNVYTLVKSRGKVTDRRVDQAQE